MGTTARVIITARSGTAIDLPHLVARSRRYVLRLEQRWSRFIDGSEVSRVNSRAGDDVLVSAETLALFRRGLAGWHLTRGRFDPTVLTSLCSLGYCSPLDAMREGPSRTPGPTAPAPGCAAIVIDEARSTIRLPRGVGFDPGGIGKGLAADMVVEDLLTAGASGACAEIGGDVSVRGEAPERRGWVVRIEDPRESEPAIGQVWLREGAVASSSCLRRTWDVDGRSLHHLVDPTTGRPTDGRLAGASVVAGRAWLAEVMATAACIHGGAEWIGELGAGGVVVPAMGPPHWIGNFADFVA
jgi:thiamine biosynthesis lipoprotein